VDCVTTLIGLSLEARSKKTAFFDKKSYSRFSTRTVYDKQYLWPNEVETVHSEQNTIKNFGAMSKEMFREISIGLYFGIYPLDQLLLAISGINF